MSAALRCPPTAPLAGVVDGNEDEEASSREDEEEEAPEPADAMGAVGILGFEAPPAGVMRARTVMVAAARVVVSWSGASPSS